MSKFDSILDRGFLPFMTILINIGALTPLAKGVVSGAWNEPSVIVASVAGVVLAVVVDVIAVRAWRLEKKFEETMELQAGACEEE